MDDIDIKEKISEQSKQALALFDFIFNLPRPVNIFVYRTIVKEAIALADLCPKEEARKDLAKSLCYAYAHTTNNSRNIVDSLHIEIESECNKFIEALYGKDFDKVEKFVKDIPSIIELTNTFYDIFKKGDTKYSFLNEDSQEPFLNATKKNYFNKVKDIEYNPFYKLSYISSVMYVFDRFEGNKPEKDIPDFNDIFNGLYVKGKILNIIFDTIYKSDVTEISQQLYDILREKCDNNSYLCDIVNNVHERYCKLHYSINRLSKFTSSRNGDNYNLYPSIGKIPDIEDYEQFLLTQELWGLFKDNVKNQSAEDIGIEAADFRGIFDDKSPRLTLKNVIHYKVRVFFQEVAKQLYVYTKKNGNMTLEKKHKTQKDFKVKIDNIIVLYKPKGIVRLSERSSEGSPKTKKNEEDFREDIRNKIKEKKEIYI